MIKYANSTMVAAAWINSVPGLSADGVACASELPDDVAVLESGFVVVTVVGGDSSGYETVGRPICQVDVYAQKNGSALWTRGQNIVQTIKAAARADRYKEVSRLLPMSVRGISYGTAMVLECGGVVMTEERKLYGDVGQAARWQFDMDFVWTVIS